jgi:hypothetical protein
MCRWGRRSWDKKRSFTEAALLETPGISSVIPAQAGIQFRRVATGASRERMRRQYENWVPAFAGTTFQG